MENSSQGPAKVAFKWTLIYVVTSIVLTFLFQFLNVDQTSPVKYIGYIPFIVFLLLAQKEYRDQLGGFLTFGQGFMSGFLYSVFAGILMAIFIYLYLGIISPQILDQTMAAQHDKYVEAGMSQEQIDNAVIMGKKYGAIFGAVAILFGTPILGAIFALIGAAIFKKEPTIADIERKSDSYIDPAV